MNPHKRAGLIVLMLLAFALLACHEEVYEMGVTMICDHGQNITTTTIIADNNTDIYPVPISYLSTDGGLHWHLSPESSQCGDQPDAYAIEEQDPKPFEIAAEDYQLRWFVNDRIEISRDQGRTWQLEYDLSFLKPEVRTFYNKIRIPQRNVTFPVPLAGIYHRASGHVIFAMGLYGVLVRDTQGQYHHVNLSTYQIYAVDFSTLIAYPEIWKIGNALLFSVMVVMLVLMNAVAWIHGLKRWQWIFILVPWGAWLWMSRMMMTPSVWWYARLDIELIFILLPPFLWALAQFTCLYRDAWKQILFTSVIAVLAYLSFFMLYATGVIVQYQHMIYLYMVVLVGILLVCGYMFRKILPRRFVPEKEKRKNDYR